MAALQSEYDQTPIEPAEDGHRVIDFLIEFGIHNNMTATVGEAFKQIPSNKLCQLRRCTLKAMIIFYAQTIIFENDKTKLLDALQCLQKLFDDNHYFNDKIVIKAWEALKRGISYQIVIHHLETCGVQSASQMINNYFPINSNNDKDIKYRNILLSFCENVENDESYKPITWNKFKNWSQISFNCMLKSCGSPLIEQVAKARMFKK